jgi:6-phosphogluconate dehydrogenase
MAKCELGLIGLAVMGQNLVLNIANHGFKIAVFNRTTETARKFMEQKAKGLPIEMGETLEEFVSLLKKPRNILVMVKAGTAVDAMIGQLVPFLDPGDMIVDCGNSFFRDTEQREKELLSKGFAYMGVGVSGGEEGALKGPSIMPGGPQKGYERLRPIFEAIAARTKDGPCVTYIGPGGAGHFVKMVHNGLEYGDMQLIAEAYDILKNIGGMKNPELAKTFGAYNKGPLASYLIEITETVLMEKDPETGKYLTELIKDSAGQKGTGQWTSQSALGLSEPVPTISAAVDARNLSAKISERQQAAKVFKSNKETVAFKGDLVKAVEAALYSARASLYSQGLSLLKKASQEFQYGLQLPELARIWKGGCIIRAVFLDTIRESFLKNPQLEALVLAPQVAERIKEQDADWRKVVMAAVSSGIPAPAFSSALAYFDGLSKTRLPANLIQAQRDFFGAHTFERIDRPGSFHHDWNGSKGKK